MNNEIKSLILGKFGTEAECARKIGWSRQRLNKITNKGKEPSVYELNALAIALEKSPNELIPFFLDTKSPNG